MNVESSGKLRTPPDHERIVVVVADGEPFREDHRGDRGVTVEERGPAVDLPPAICLASASGDDLSVDLDGHNVFIDADRHEPDLHCLDLAHQCTGGPGLSRPSHRLRRRRRTRVS